MRIFSGRRSVFAGCFSLSLVLTCNIGLAEEIESLTVSAIPLNVNEAGSSVSIITKEDIFARGLPSIQSLLREVAGFAVSQQGSQGAVTQLRARGAEANQILVLIDGVEANDIAQGSEFDFSQLSTSDIERIEIVRGPQSALWGSDALACRSRCHIGFEPEREHPINARDRIIFYEKSLGNLSKKHGKSLGEDQWRLSRQ